jgi:hypothetical protein
MASPCFNNLKTASSTGRFSRRPRPSLEDWAPRMPRMRGRAGEPVGASAGRIGRPDAPIHYGLEEGARAPRRPRLRAVRTTCTTSYGFRLGYGRTRVGPRGWRTAVRHRGRAVRDRSTGRQVPRGPKTGTVGPRRPEASRRRAGRSVHIGAQPAELLTIQAVLNPKVHCHTLRAPPVGIEPSSPLTNC